MENCPFCNIDRNIILSNENSLAIYDNYPVSNGHLLVIPKTHIADYFDLKRSEKESLWDLVDKVKLYLQHKYNPDGFNVGFNVNKSAGQTVFHVHIHVIPRYEGDVDDPTGGVRGVIDDKRIYH